MIGGPSDFTERTRNWLRKLRGRPAKHEEVRMLRPVALAGASRRSDAYRYSRPCSSFATTLQNSYENPYSVSADGYDYYLPRNAGLRRKAMSDGAEVHVEWRRCQMCARNFVVGVTPYKHHCSIDCKSASLLEEPNMIWSDDEM